mmetsp:Transcript_4407/g.10919  ORF Transcript_4407/g.10919 Transcript_4407/m.10919 type:complete len:235 (-) Transcript_4407:171-875(-)
MVQTSTSAPTLAAVPAGGSPLSLLTSFQGVQRQRAQLYARLHQGFRRFLETRQEGIYKTLMADVTVAFSECSQQVIAAEEELKDRCGRADLALLLRRVQVLEREKLALTLSLQALKQAGSVGVFSWQRAAASGAEQAAGGSFGAQGEHDPLEPHSPQGHGEAHGHGHEHQHGEGCGHAHHACCGHSAPPDEPTQEEYQGALDEAIQQLDKCVNSINEVLEEVQEHVAELREDEA